MKVQIPGDKYSHITTKDEMVEAMREPIISAANAVLDRLIDKVDFLEVTEKTRNLTEEEINQKKTFTTSIKTYQSLVNKLKNKEELTAIDFGLVMLITATTANFMEEQIKLFKDAAAELRRISWKIDKLKLAVNKEKESNIEN